MKKRAIFSLTGVLITALLTASGHIAKGAVWQWSVLVKNGRNNVGQARAYLWIPANCKKVNGIVYAQNNMEEQDIIENAQFRQEMGKLGFAEVWVSPGSDLQFLFNKGTGESFNEMINDLAAVSGYTELIVAPVVPMGHSAAASAPYYFAAWNPGRTLACVSVSGQWPYVRNDFAPDIWSRDQHIDYIPCLETMGEYESANTWSVEGLKEKKDHPMMPLSMLACPAEFHFSTTDAKTAYIAFYIKKAAQYRLPKNTPDGEAPKLIPIDPTKTGWLVDKWRFNELPKAAPAPVGSYKGDPNEAFWFLDEEMAKTTVTYEAKHRNQKPELIGYIQHGKMIEQRNVHQQVNLKFEPERDGITFKIRTAFYDTVPGGSPRPKNWAKMPVGTKIGHAKGGGPIHVNRVTGPFIKLNDTTFQVHPQLGFWQNQHSYEFWFVATHPGDEEYKPAVQQSEMLVPPRNTQGKEQHITFLTIPDQTKNKKGIKLTATSDANVPVGFYVAEGPAEIEGGHLNITTIPPRSHYPVKVTVVAWQYGNSNEPQLQTAMAVEQTFFIKK